MDRKEELRKHFSWVEETLEKEFPHAEFHIGFADFDQEIFYSLWIDGCQLVIRPRISMWLSRLIIPERDTEFQFSEYPAMSTFEITLAALRKSIDEFKKELEDDNR